MRNPSCWHCGVPLQQSAKIVGGVDIGLGALTAILVGVYLNSDQDHRHSIRIQSHGHGTKYSGGWYYTTLTREHYIVMGAASIVQIVMGIALFVGATNKSKTICWAWMITTFVGCFMVWSSLVRIYMLVVVGAFIREMGREAEVGSFAGAGRPFHPKPPLQVLQVQQPPPPMPSNIQHLHPQQGMWIPPQQQQPQQQQQQLGSIDNGVKHGNGMNGHPQIQSQQVWEKS